MYKTVDAFMEVVKNKNPEQAEFHQAVEEVVESIWDYVNENPHYLHSKILDRLVEPERVIMFRVPWRDDQGNVQVNRGYRVEFNSAIGPYKGGLRFHPSVSLSILKFLYQISSYPLTRTSNFCLYFQCKFLFLSFLSAL